MSTSFPGSFGAHAAEVVPRIDQLSVTENQQPLLERYIAETEDDPSVNLDMLSQAEKRRLAFHIVSSTDFDGYAGNIAATMREVDYCIVEHALPEASSALRRVHDIALNLGLRGVSLQVEQPAPGEQSGDPSGEYAARTLAPDLRREDSFMARYAAHSHGQDRPSLPVVRTMGLSDYDIIPDFGMTVSDADAWRQKLLGGMEAGLLTLPNESLMSIYGTSFTFSAPKAIALERQRQAAVSSIAANAVLRHPDKETVTVGVLTSSYDSHLPLSVLRSGNPSSLTHSHVPDFRGGGLVLQDPHARAMQEATEAADKRPSQDSMKRALLSDYLRDVFSDSHENDRESVERVARSIDSLLSADNVNSLLQRIDEAKAEKLPRFNWSKTPDDVRRRQRISKAILAHPAIDLLGITE